MTAKETEFETNDDLREAYERQKSGRSDAEGKLESITFKALSLDPNKGIGKAFKMTYEGSIEPDELPAIQEALKTEFDYSPPSSAPEPEPTPDPKSANQDISDGERQIADLIDQSNPAPIDPNADATQKAEESGDWAAVFEIGLNQQGVKMGQDL